MLFEQNRAQELRNNPGGLENIANGIEAINKVAHAPVGGPYTLVGWKMKESDYKSNIEKYFSMLDQTQKECFASLDMLLKNSMDGTDTHILAF